MADIGIAEGYKFWIGLKQGVKVDWVAWPSELLVRKHDGHTALHNDGMVCGRKAWTSISLAFGVAIPHTD